MSQNKLINFKENLDVMKSMDNLLYQGKTNVANILKCLLDRNDDTYKFELKDFSKINIICPKCFNGYLFHSLYHCTNSKDDADKISLELVSCSNYKSCDFVTNENIIPKFQNKLVKEKIESLEKARVTRDERRLEKDAYLVAYHSLRDEIDKNSLWNIFKALFQKAPLKLSFSFLIVIIACGFMLSLLMGNSAQSIKATLFGNKIEINSQK